MLASMVVPIMVPLQLCLAIQTSMVISMVPLPLFKYVSCTVISDHGSSSNREMEEDGRAAQLPEDVLEELISHVSPLDLVAASHVSRSWRHTVASSLRRFPRRRIPWLILHVQSRRHVITHAYDPHSCTWIRTGRRPLPAAALRSSHPGLLHALSPTDLTFSTDAFGVIWRRAPPLPAWRHDAVVALVCSHLVAVGGAGCFESEFDPLTVEMWGTRGAAWEACEPMPEVFKGSAAGTWLSVAAGERELHVLEKLEGLLGSFDVETKRWGRVCKLSMQPAVFLSAIGLAGERLILVSAAGEAANVVSITLWEVEREQGDRVELREIAAMPAEMMGRMVGDGWGLSSSIGFSVVGDFGYLYNPSDPTTEVFLCEFGESGCRWESVPRAADVVSENAMHSMVFRCSAVGMDDLRRISSPARMN